MDAGAHPICHWINSINNWLIIQVWKWGNEVFMWPPQRSRSPRGSGAAAVWEEVYLLGWVSSFLSLQDKWGRQRRLAAFNGAGTCLTGFCSRWGKPESKDREAPSPKQWVHLPPVNTTTDMNQAHSCPGNCSAPHIIYAPLPSPASCSYSHDSVYTLASSSRGHSRLHTHTPLKWCNTAITASAH